MHDDDNVPGCQAHTDAIPRKGRDCGTQLSAVSYPRSVRVTHLGGLQG